MRLNGQKYSVFVKKMDHFKPLKHPGVQGLQSMSFLLQNNIPDFSRTSGAALLEGGQDEVALLVQVGDVGSVVGQSYVILDEFCFCL